jgi:arylsulfatase A
VSMLSRRHFLWASSAALACRPSQPPNIVIMLADDLGHGDLRCYNPEARTATPALDRLAGTGVRFTDAHSPSALCTPTRYGLLTGRYCWRTSLKRGVLNGWSPYLLERDLPTIASLAKRSGYRTACFGKWHLGMGREEKTNYDSELSPGPNDAGFDEFVGIPASLDMPPYVWVENRRVVEKPTATIETNGAPPRGAYWRGGPIAPGFRMDDVLPSITRHATAFIRANRSRPFLVYVPFTAPHTPWVPLTKGRSSAGLYGDFVAQVDDCAGAVLNAVADAGLEHNTLVVFTSDNGAPWSAPDVDASGGHRANAPWRGQKGDIHEGGHRVPFIARWPAKLQSGTVSDRLVCLTDFYATLASIFGASVGAGDSFDFLPGSSRSRESIVHHSGGGMFAVRRGPWKLIEGLGSGGFTQPSRITPTPGQSDCQLYNLLNDPREEMEVCAENPGVVAGLRDELEETRGNC